MMLLPYRIGFGAVIGDGTQHLSWIHIEDLLRLIAFCVKDESIHGKINAVTPDQPTYAEFAHAIGRLLQRPVFLKIPDPLLRKCLGEMASMFADGPRIIPGRLKQQQFEYRFPDLRSAIIDLA